MSTSRITEQSGFRGGAWARGANVALGFWLFVSAFLWPHSGEQLANTWIMGLVTMAAAGLALVASDTIRYIDTAAGIWLFISSFTLLEVSRGTAWNNAIVGIAVAVISLIPTRATSPRARFGHRPT